MGAYGKAGLGMGLASGLQTMGEMLLNAQDRSERRAFQQYQIQQEARDRKEREEDRQFQRWMQKEEFRRAGQASERAEQVRRAQAFAGAERDAAELQGRGVDAFVEPPAISVTGDPMKPNGLQQSTSLPIMPRMVVGGYNPERDPAFQRTRATGEYFTSKGYGVEGQLPPRASTPEEPPDAWISVGGRKFANTPEGQAEAIVWNERLNPPKAGGDAESRMLEMLKGGGEGEAPRGRRSFFGSGADAVADTIPSQGDDPALRALNTAHREGAITQEQHADALNRYRTGKVTADQILGWLTGS